MRPLNFLHLTTFYPPYSFGGDAIYLYRLSHALGEAGHHVDVVHCRDSYHLLHPGEPEIKFNAHPNVRVHELRSPYRWLSPLLTQQTGAPFLKRKRIVEIMGSRDYDVIEYHNISLLGPGVLRMSPPGRKPIKMYMTHEHWLICPTHVLWKFNKRPCEKPDCLRCTLLQKRPPQLWRYGNMLRDAGAHVDQYVSPSRFTAQMHAERGFPYPVAHLPYFIDRVDEDWQQPDPRPQPEPYFLFVGRLERIKGLQTLIDVWGSVQADLLVAGTGTDEEFLRARAAGNPRIKFLGPIPPKQLGALYFHALACLVPSVTYETFGIIIIEAFARKTPVIVRDLGALPEVVQDSGGGFTFQTDAELLQALNSILTKPSLRSQLGERGYRAFLQNWTREAHFTLYFNYLEDIALRRYGHVPWLEKAGHAAQFSTR
ncbi:MAG: glycosyltransferase family 1 protein [Acidobacteria bacterium]|nr:MAG: glycosyltransferase family 1 protein [Acidobacteriota bacterium]